MLCVMEHCTDKLLPLSLGVAKRFIYIFFRFDFSFNCAPDIMIKRAAYWGIRRPDIRGDVVEEIVCQSWLGFLVCVA